MSLEHPNGRSIPDAVGAEMVGETIRRCGRFVMQASVAPRIGQIQIFAGLPMRATRIISYEDAAKDFVVTEDLWGPDNRDPEDIYFECEVAD